MAERCYRHAGTADAVAGTSLSGPWRDPVNYILDVNAICTSIRFWAGTPFIKPHTRHRTALSRGRGILLMCKLQRAWGGTSGWPSPDHILVLKLPGTGGTKCPDLCCPAVTGGDQLPPNLMLWGSPNRGKEFCGGHPKTDKYGGQQDRVRQETELYQRAGSSLLLMSKAAGPWITTGDGDFQLDRGIAGPRDCMRGIPLPRGGRNDRCLGHGG